VRGLNVDLCGLQIAANGEIRVTDDGSNSKDEIRVTKQVGVRPRVEKTFDLEERTESKETKHSLRMMAVAAPDLAADARILWQETKELNLIFGKIRRTIE
jgi:hypothetical protein